MNIRRSSSFGLNQQLSPVRSTGQSSSSKAIVSNNSSPLHEFATSHQSDSSQQSLSVEQKLSYKVAELTQVIHLLFVKCQEKELQCGVLQQQVDTLRETLEVHEKEKGLGHEEWNQQKTAIIHERNRLINFNKILEGKLRTAEERQHELMEQVTAKEHEFHDMQSRHFASQAHQNEEISSLRSELKNYQEKLDQQAHQVKDVMNQMSVYRSEMEAKLNHQIKSKQHLQNLLDIDRGALQEARNKTQQLEAEVKNYQREMKKLRDGSDNKSLSKNQTQNLGGVTFQTEASSSMEVQQLKDEILRYKLELFNREQNFNKIFSDKRYPQQALRLSTSSTALPTNVDSPLAVDDIRLSYPVPPPKTASSQSVIRQNGGPVRISSSSTNRFSATGPLISFHREKTFSYVSGQSFDEEKLMTNAGFNSVSVTNQRSSQTSNSASKLPHVNRTLQRNVEAGLVKQRLF